MYSPRLVTPKPNPPGGASIHYGVQAAATPDAASPAVTIKHTVVPPFLIPGPAHVVRLDKQRRQCPILGRWQVCPAGHPAASWPDRASAASGKMYIDDAQQLLEEIHPRFEWAYDWTREALEAILQC